MRAAVFSQLGGAGVLSIADLPLPDPGPSEIRLRITSAGLNRADLLFREGRYFTQPRLPSRSGKEAGGIVDAVGPGSAWRAGDRVAVLPAMLDESLQGGAAEFLIAPDDLVVATPPGIDDRDAGALWMQYLTAYGAVADFGRVSAGDLVVVTAASSSTGLAAIAVAKALGARVIATTRREAKADRLVAAGADAVVVGGASLAEEARRWSSGRGAALVFDPVGGPGSAALVDLLREEGQLIVYGVLDPAPWTWSGARLMLRNTAVRGFYLVPYLTDVARRAMAVRWVHEGLASGRLPTGIDRYFPLDAVAEAHHYMQAGNQVGKIVILP
jgi:NADPH2:quinone reductase